MDVKIYIVYARESEWSCFVGNECLWSIIFYLEMTVKTWFGESFITPL